MKHLCLVIGLGCVACSQVLGLEEAERRPGAGGGGGSGAVGGTSGGAGGAAGAAGTVGGTPSGGTAGAPAGGAAGSAGAGGAAGNGGAAGDGGAAGTGASAGDGGAAGSAGTGGADTCVWTPLDPPWVKVPFNGSFETWTGSLPASFTSGDIHPPNGEYAKVVGCHGENALRLSDTSEGGAIHGARGFFTPPAVGQTSCWLLRGYGRLVSGRLLGAGATLVGATGALFNQPLASTSGWLGGESLSTLTEPLGSTPFVQITITADTLSEISAADFDNIELWYHEGACD